VRRALWTLAAVAALTLATGCGGDSETPAAASGPAVVERVVDGDTIVARAGGDRVTVRLLGIDTPESVKPEAPVECYGPEAATRALELLPAGAAVRIETDPTQDQVDDFGRTLAYVFLGRDARPVNRRLVAEGYARVYVFHPERPFARAAEFRAAERAARERGRGLWGACDGAGAAAGGGGERARGRDCPAGSPIKGNLPSGIYHRPGDESYADTRPERCFATPADAERAGFRAARA
jgi:micrococcal nuclease